ncbi:MAG: hypothetical protein CVU14_11240, partial [Bacteroidetes bacterium HGW-Bacteroidetes-9]
MRPDKKLLILTLSFLILVNSALFGDNPPTAKIVRTTEAPRIDGNINEPVWETATTLTEFRQHSPVFNANPSFPTKVLLLYDNEAVYVAAILSDPHPDSIANQLGERDNEDLNADYFGIGFDTYNNQQDAYYFLVSASDIQVDGRKADGTYDAV